MKTRKASCACGQLLVETSADPVRISVCHCLDCQRRSGSVFAAQARFPSSAVVVRGISDTFVRVGERKTTFHFCRTCGSTVYYLSEGDDRIAIPIGAFADPAFPAPTVSVYGNRMHSWVQLPESIEHLE